jgi:transcriptional regulator GlxA family with amidase domain
VPNGAGNPNTDLANVRVISWIKKATQKAKLITSHCEGAFWLGQAGLTSYEASLDVVEQLFGKDQALSIAKALIFGPSNMQAASTTK